MAHEPVNVMYIYELYSPVSCETVEMFNEPSRGVNVSVLYRERQRDQKKRESSVQACEKEFAVTIK